MSIHLPEEEQALVQIVRQMIEQDDELRKKYGVQNKFRFIQDRLTALLSNVEGSLQHKEDNNHVVMTHVDVGADETIVYVHLFNAHGAMIRTWQNMLMPKIFYEYSVNRPIYAEKNQMEAVIKAKTNRAQHGYLMVAVKTEDIQKNIISQKDSYGNDLIKIREGSLHVSKLMGFVHNEITYTLNEKGELIRKE